MPGVMSELGDVAGVPAEARGDVGAAGAQRSGHRLGRLAGLEPVQRLDAIRRAFTGNPWTPPIAPAS
jgi:hypothetical protein